MGASNHCALRWALRIALAALVRPALRRLAFKGRRLALMG